jgi:minichromosome maintenance protein 10
MIGRGTQSKEERFRRRIVEQQREREIANILTSSRGGGIAADYLRAQNNENIPAAKKAPTRSGAPHKRTNSSDPKLATSSDSNEPLTMSFKRAEAVRLSPKKRAHDGDRPHGSGVKKTRFITSKGIKEAGRDSLGGNTDACNDFDDDDELEIV